MASYRIISPTLWQDPEFRQLTPIAGYMLVQLRLMATNIIALYKPDWELIGELTHLDRDGRKEVLAELGKPKQSGSPWVLHEDGYAWVVNGFRHEFGFTDSGDPRLPSGHQIKAVERALAGVPRHVELIQKFAVHYACPDYPALDGVLIPYRQGVDTALIHLGRETGSGSGSGNRNGKPETGTGSRPQASPDGIRLAQLAFGLVSKNHPNIPALKRPGTVAAWAKSVDRFLKQTGKTAKEVGEFFGWAAEDRCEPKPGKRPWTGWWQQFQSVGLLDKDAAWASFASRSATVRKPYVCED